MIVLAAACIVAVSLLVGRLPPGVNPLAGQAVGTLEDIQGEVRIVSAEGRVELAENGQSLFAGQEIETGLDDSSTVMRLPEGRLTLASETRMRIGRGDDLTPQFFVTEGIVSAEAAPERSCCAAHSPNCGVRKANSAS